MYTNLQYSSSNVSDLVVMFTSHEILVTTFILLPHLNVNSSPSIKCKHGLQFGRLHHNTLGFIHIPGISGKQGPAIFKSLTDTN